MPKLTIKEIDVIQAKLKAGEAVPSMIPDGGGLYLRTRKTGGMSFVIKRWGFPVLTLGSVDMGLAVARKEAAKALALQAQGVDPSQAKREARAAKKAEAFKTDETFDEVLKRFVERHCKPNLRTSDEVGVNAGEKIEQTLKEMAPDAEIHFERLAVNIEQINSLGLPTRPTKKSDSRSKAFGDISVELDAIHPDTLRNIVEQAINRHLPQDELAVLLEAERSEREHFMRMAQMLKMS